MSSLATGHPMVNKLWPHDRFQIADALSRDFDLVQVGMPSDQPISGAIDVRGNTIRETAAIFSASVLFVGLATGLMRLARAVDCRSVIIYGGREDPSQTGYSANENLSWKGSCSPCWLDNECEFERRCMSEVGAEQVIAAARRQGTLFGTALPVERVAI
jgi:ADP-heptose:LPS heptosyltransferase